MLSPQDLECQKPALFERLPSAHKPLLGFHRRVLMDLAEAGVIRLIQAHIPGRRFPVPLIYVPSLIQYIFDEERRAANRREEGFRQQWVTARQSPEQAMAADVERRPVENKDADVAE
jgi:hypothetical protein